MNFDELQSAWNSPRNNPSAAQQRQLAEQFVRQMIRRRRFQLLWLINTFVWLTVISILAMRAIALGKVNVAVEWGLLPLLTLPWLFAFHFLRIYVSDARPVARGEVPVADALRAAMESNRAEQSHLKKVGLLFAIMIPALALSVYQLRLAQKVQTRELVCMAAFFAVVLFISGAGIAARYFGRVLPRQRRIAALLDELAEGNR